MKPIEDAMASEREHDARTPLATLQSPVRTVDLVIGADASTACPAAIDALQRGRSVLVVLRSRDVRAGRRLRRCLCRAAGAERRQVVVMTGAEVVCVDGVDGVEAVVIRYVETGRLRAVNASAAFQCVIA